MKLRNDPLGGWRPTGFVAGLDHPLYVIEINCEYVGRCEWWIYHTPTGYRVADGMTRDVGDAQRAAEAAAAELNPP